MVITLKEIFDNEWEDFRKTSNSPDLKRKAVHDNVWKMRYCKTPWMGVAVYQCPNHFEEVKLFACTCKSRFCPPCGFKANQVWFHNLMQRVAPWIWLKSGRSSSHLHAGQLCVAVQTCLTIQLCYCENVNYT